MSATLLLVDPAHYDVSYAINPWMRPDAWRDGPDAHRAEARAAWAALGHALADAGATLRTLDGVPGLPDMVFPANAAVVLDRRAVVARFRHPERQGEEAHFARAFEALRADGLLDEVVHLPDGVLQEGAGDCIWDRTRRVFWVGYGQRSDPTSVAALGAIFGVDTIPLELVDPRFYHLDTCFCALPDGAVLFYPPAFSAASLARLREHVPERDRIEATDDDAARFSVNAVALERTVVMAEPPPALGARLGERGYRVVGVDLSPFILSGGGAYCMTLRLDLLSGSGA